MAAGEPCDSRPCNSSQFDTIKSAIHGHATAYGETDPSPDAPHGKKPHGHYTARLLARLPIARFRRCSLNPRSRKWLHLDVTILIGDNGDGSTNGALRG